MVVIKKPRLPREPEATLVFIAYKENSILYFRLGDSRIVRMDKTGEGIQETVLGRDFWDLDETISKEHYRVVDGVLVDPIEGLILNESKIKNYSTTIEDLRRRL